MFIELNNKNLVNVFWLDDVYQDVHTKTNVIYVYVNGSKKIESFEDDSQAESRVTEIKEKLLNM